MPEYRPEIFISATSHDLRSYREVVTEELFKAGYHPVVQEYFGADHRSLTRKLDESIGECRAAICLVGHVFGATPDPEGDEPRSYTQMEYDAARRLGIRVYILFAQDDTIADNASDELEVFRELQATYRESLLTEGTASFFDSHASLREHTLRIIPHLPGAQLLPKWTHVPMRPSYFAGREFELGQLSITREEFSNCVVAVTGLGGQGKSTLVYEWVKRIEAEDPDYYRAQYWCTAMQGGLTFDAFLDNILEYLLGDGYDKRSEPELSVRIGKLLGVMNGRRILIVLDGVERWLVGWAGPSDSLAEADTVEHRTGTTKELNEFLAQATGVTSGTRLILTSRALPAILDNAACSIVPVYENGLVGTLQGLDDDAVVDLFGRLGVQGTRESLTALSKPHANHPLAVTVLAGLIKKKYGGDLGKTKKVSALDRRRALFLLFEEARENLPGGVLSERILQLASHCLENASLDTLVALFELLGEALSIPAEYDDAEEFLREIAITLGDWHLVDWVAVDQSIALHPLVKEFFVNRAPDSKRIHAALQAWYTDRPIPDSSENLSDVKTRDLAIQHALLAGGYRSATELFYGSLTATATFVEWLQDYGHFTKGIEIVEAIADETDAIDTAELRVTQAAFQRPLGLYDEAIEGLTSSISLLESAAGDRDSDVMSNLVGALINRGNVYRSKARGERAEADFNQALDLCGDRWGESQTRDYLGMSVLMNRGNLYKDQGYITRALYDYDHAIALYEKTFEAEHRIVDDTYANLLSNRSNVLAILGRFDSALADTETAINIYRNLVNIGLAEKQPSLINAELTMANVLFKKGDWSEASTLYDRAVKIFSEYIEQGRLDLELDTATALIGRSRVREQIGHFDDALEDLERARRIYGRLLQSGRLEIRAFDNQCLLSRGLILLRKGDRSKAEESRNDGFAMMLESVDEGEMDQLIMFIGYWGKLLSAEFDVGLETAPNSLTGFLNLVEWLLDQDEMPEETWIEAARAMENLRSHELRLHRSDIETKRFTDLLRLVISRRLVF